MDSGPELLGDKCLIDMTYILTKLLTQDCKYLAAT